MAFRGGRGGMQDEDSSGVTFRGAGRGGGGRGGTFDQRPQSNDYNSRANDGGGNSYRGGRGSSNDYDNRYNDSPPSRGGRGGFDHRPQSNDYNARSNDVDSGAYRGGRGQSNDYGSNGNRYNNDNSSFRGGRGGGNDYNGRSNDSGNGPYRGGRGQYNEFSDRGQSNDYNSRANDGGGNSYRGGRGSSNDYDNRYNDSPPSRGGRGGFDHRPQSNDYNARSNDVDSGAYRGGRGQSNDYGNRYNNDNSSFRGGRGGGNDYNGRSNDGGGFHRGGRGSSNDYNNGPPFRGGRGGYNGNGSRPGGYNFGGEMDRMSRPSHIPVERSVDEIFKEDEKHKQTNDFYSLDGQVAVENGPEPLTVIEKWEEAEFDEIIMNNIRRSNYSFPRNFQKYAMPVIMDGFDVKGQAETGSGKSAAFLLPIIQKLHDEFKDQEETERLCSVSALIIEPTRELAAQLYEQAKKFADKTKVRVNVAYGDYKIYVNREYIYQNGCDILVGTPGRLIDFMSSDDRKAQFLKYDKLKFLVLDEADELLKSSFMPEVQRMVTFPTFPSVENRQTLFFSATFSPQIMQLSNMFCKPKSVIVRNKNRDLNQRVLQEIIEVPYENRKAFLFEFFKEEKEKNNGVLPKTLCFVETKRDADTLALALQAQEYMTQTVNGDRTQQQREEATRAFRDGKLHVVVATNVFARGLDIADLDHVINVHMPSERDTWVHRNGRTGRLNAGKATTFFDPNYEEDRKMAHVIIDEFTKMGIECPEFVRKVVDNAGCDFTYGLKKETEQPSIDEVDLNEPELNAPEF
ncbi:hypothetical protein M3Y98_00739100 [Aphelenchoides besseyi]|nr:hypothetical protein M3Y98_00739100 [Aphelenchoides besseyi]